MDYLQYIAFLKSYTVDLRRFKPCYKWITFNTDKELIGDLMFNGFKPCYKWITFNTLKNLTAKTSLLVLNLVINGLPSIPILNSSGNAVSYMF